MMIMVMITMMMTTVTVIMMTVVEIMTTARLTTLMKMMFKLWPMCRNALEIQNKWYSQSCLPLLECLAVCVLWFHCVQQCHQISKPSFQYHCLRVLCLDYISLWQVQHPMHLSVNQKGKRSSWDHVTKWHSLVLNEISGIKNLRIRKEICKWIDGLFKWCIHFKTNH